MAIIDCYGNDDSTDHDDPNYVEIAHIAYLYMNGEDEVEVIIKSKDDINYPCFYILSNDRMKELYKIPLFDNNVNNLTESEKRILNMFIKYEHGDYDSNVTFLNTRRVFDIMKWLWVRCNNCNEDLEKKYMKMEPPNYI